MKWYKLFAAACTLYSCQQSPKPELIFDAQAKLGEGAFWHQPTKKLFWVDIEGQLLHVSDPFLHTDTAYQMNSRIGTVVPSADGQQALVALQSGIHLFDPQTGGFSHVAHPIDSLQTVMRYNDGKCDPAGRLWVGGMHLKQETGAASLYCIQPNGEWRAAIKGVTISNGIVWNAVADMMYYIDTPTLTIKAFPYNNETGEIGEGKVVVSVPKGMGYPDGMAIDEEGMLWVALWAGHGVARWNPNTGELLEKITVPAPNTTSCAFGGASGRTLYITSAREGLTDKELKEYPQSGGVFAVEVGVKGGPMAFFTPLP